MVSIVNLANLLEEEQRRPASELARPPTLLVPRIKMKLMKVALVNN